MPTVVCHLIKLSEFLSNLLELFGIYDILCSYPCHLLSIWCAVGIYLFKSLELPATKAWFSTIRFRTILYFWMFFMLLGCMKSSLQTYFLYAFEIFFSCPNPLLDYFRFYKIRFYFENTLDGQFYWVKFHKSFNAQLEVTRLIEKYTFPQLIEAWNYGNDECVCKC